jgi:hypothetical protein
MTFAPGQSGNPGGRPKRDKIWKDAIIRAIKRREDTDPHALEKLADKLLAGVDAGDVAAMKEFGDRVDGKVAQAIVGGDDDDAPVRLETIRRIIVDPGHSDGGGVPPAAGPSPV